MRCSTSGNISLVCRSPAMQAVVRTAERIGPSEVSVLITGEIGTGKEVIADLIHAMSQRSNGEIIKINCAGLPQDRIDGSFRQAEDGTLFLDEISEMPIDTQSKLLRLLQDQEVRPIGGKTSCKTNCRLIAATNRKPEDAIKDGKLRRDLYDRISVISMHLAPLRDRCEDIIPLAIMFLKHFASQENRPIRGFTQPAKERLIGSEWPGNVRQLQKEIHRAVLLSAGDLVDASDLLITGHEPASNETQDTSLTLLEGVERNAIIQMLKDTNGNKIEAAKRLGIGRQTLYNKIKAYGIEV